MGNFWNGSYVHSSGCLKLNLANNFFLELNAQAIKLKVCETTSGPAVRGSTHVIAYAKAWATRSGSGVSERPRIGKPGGEIQQNCKPDHKS
ncbi:hypothetical protein V5E97_11205 [Singulisphaera sp. Ch08]|uniref:Uncharacterized protein n=1 Tax=Singulisphaera sp. Ch08 TaxID=3120278 RepID=A0AAU7CMW7_9BACT